MREPRRFDPIGWFLSASCALLIGAIALTVAIRLVQQIWVWLVVGVLAAAVVGIGIRVAIAMHRRQSW